MLPRYATAAYNETPRAALPGVLSEIRGAFLAHYPGLPSGLNALVPLAGLSLFIARWPEAELTERIQYVGLASGNVTEAWIEEAHLLLLGITFSKRAGFK
jgi:hypothetical protein